MPFLLCRTGGEVATRFLLTSGTLSEDAEESIEKGVEDETGPHLPPVGTVRTAWQALQIYLVRLLPFGSYDMAGFESQQLISNTW